MADSRASRSDARRRRRERDRIRRLVLAIARHVEGELPSVSALARRRRDPFRILVSTVISLRTKDEVTEAASERLFAIAPDAPSLARTPLRRIERAIYPAGFYRTKARHLREAARRIVDEFGGRVPDTVEGLLALRGVGRKTAALVVSLGYGRDAICVDTHVHRISNRLGLVDTRTPDETERALMDRLPRSLWIGYNEWLVRFGQTVCRPISPLCSRCPVSRRCARRGVTRSR